MTVDALVRRQAGVIARAQAVELGMSRHAVDRLVRSGRWRPMHPGVFLVAGARRTDEARLRAAALWAGPDAVVHGAAAAWWHGMLDAPLGLVTLTVPPAQRRTPPSGVTVRRRTLPAADLAVRLDVPVVGEALAAIEAAVDLGAGGARFLDRALQRHVRFPAVYRAHCRNLGRRGSREAGRLIVASADRAASAAERRLVGLLREDGVPGWELGYRYEAFVLDLAFPSARLAVEVDGWAWHVDIERFQADRRRQNRLVAEGWTVLRLTWHDLQERPDEVVAEIRAELYRASPDRRPPAEPRRIR